MKILGSYSELGFKDFFDLVWNYVVFTCLYFRAEQKLSDLEDSRSNDGSGHLSPRNSLLTTWSSFDKSKSHVIIKKLNQDKMQAIEELKRLKEENLELNIQVEKLTCQNKGLVLKHESLKDNFNSFKVAMSQQEDPFVLRLALDQSKRDFCKLASEFSTFKDTYQYGIGVPQVEYNEIYMKLKKAEEELEYLKDKQSN